MNPHIPNKMNHRHLLLIARFCLLMGLAVTRAFAQGPDFPRDGLIGYFPFNGDARDFSGNGLDGTVHGLSFAPDRFGVANRAFFFNGTTDYIEVPRSESFNFGTNDFTLSVWIKPAGFARNAYVVGKAFPSAGRGYGLATTGLNTAYAFIAADLPYVELYGGSGISTGGWHHLIAVYKRNSSLLIYDDGVLVGQTPIGSEAGDIDNPEPLSIGKAISDASPFAGSIDDVRIYDRALSDAEAKALHELEKTPIPNGRTATATAEVVNGFVVGVNVVDGGTGYLSPPAVHILGSGMGATATATVENGAVKAITINSAGSDYLGPVTVVIDPPSDQFRRATGISRVDGGLVTEVLVGDSGAGYLAPPKVFLVGGGGTGAEAVASVVNGVVTGVTLVNPGTGYSTAPTVVFSSPSGNTLLEIEVARIRIVQHVTIGQLYLLESSPDLLAWSSVGVPFVATASVIPLELDVVSFRKYFRLREVP